MVFLIADDNIGKMLMLKTLVEKSNIATKILTAETTEEAKQLIDTHHIDAAFIDYYFPSENGPAVIAYLHEKQPQTHIALVSSSDNTQNQEKAVKSGAETCICTSYDEEIVRKSLENILEQWKKESL